MWLLTHLNQKDKLWRADMYDNRKTYILSYHWLKVPNPERSHFLHIEKLSAVERRSVYKDLQPFIQLKLFVWLFLHLSRLKLTKNHWSISCSLRMTHESSEKHPTTDAKQQKLQLDRLKKWHAQRPVIINMPICKLLLFTSSLQILEIWVVEALNTRHFTWIRIQSNRNLGKVLH